MPFTLTNKIIYIMGVTQFIILQAILGNYLLIQHPFNTREVYVCFDSNGTRDESWPSKWVKMETYTPNNAATLKSQIPTNSTMYKVRIVKGNGSTKDSEWLSLYNKDPNKSESSNTNALYITIYYIAVCSTLSAAELLIRIIQNYVTY